MRNWNACGANEFLKPKMQVLIQKNHMWEKCKFRHVTCFGSTSRVLANFGCADSDVYAQEIGFCLSDPCQTTLASTRPGWPYDGAPAPLLLTRIHAQARAPCPCSTRSSVHAPCPAAPRAVTSYDVASTPPPGRRARSRMRSTRTSRQPRMELATTTRATQRAREPMDSHKHSRHKGKDSQKLYFPHAPCNCASGQASSAHWMGRQSNGQLGNTLEIGFCDENYKFWERHSKYSTSETPAHNGCDIHDMGLTF